MSRSDPIQDLIIALEGVDSLRNSLQSITTPLYNGYISKVDIQLKSADYIIFSNRTAMSIRTLLDITKPTETAICCGAPVKLYDVARIESYVAKEWAEAALFQAGRTSINKPIAVGHMWGKIQPLSQAYPSLWNVIMSTESQIQSALDRIKEAGITSINFNLLIFRNIVDSNISLKNIIQEIKTIDKV